MVFVPVKRKGLYCVVTIVIVQKSILSWIVLISEFHWSGWLNWRCGTDGSSRGVKHDIYVSVVVGGKHALLLVRERNFGRQVRGGNKREGE